MGFAWGYWIEQQLQLCYKVLSSFLESACASAESELSMLSHDGCLAHSMYANIKPLIIK